MTGPPAPRFIGRLEGYVEHGAADGRFWAQTSPVTFVSEHQYWWPKLQRHKCEFPIAASPERPFWCDLESWDLAEWYRTGLAGILHDWLFRTGHVDRATADALYHEALIALGLSRWRAFVRWAGVRVGGWSAWRKHRMNDGKAS